MSKCEQCIIKQFNALRTLSKDELMRISACKTSTIIKKGEQIFKEGDVVNGVYCIQDGVCKLSKLSANGNHQIVKLVLKGDLLGQRSLVADEYASLTAVALNDMQVCFIPKEQILNDLLKNPNFSMGMLKDMAKDLRESDSIIVNMAQKTVRQRLADTLMYLHENFGKAPDGSINIIISREDFASIIGTAKESAIRMLSQFKKEGLISFIGKKIKIENLTAISKIN